MSLRTLGTEVIRLEHLCAPIPLRCTRPPIPVTSRLFHAPLPLSAKSQFSITATSAATTLRPVILGVPGKFTVAGTARAARTSAASAYGACAVISHGTAERRISASAVSGFSAKSVASLQAISYEAFIPADQEEALVDADGETFMSFITLEGSE